MPILWIWLLMFVLGQPQGPGGADVGRTGLSRPASTVTADDGGSSLPPPN